MRQKTGFAAGSAGESALCFGADLADAAASTAKALRPDHSSPRPRFGFPGTCTGDIYVGSAGAQNIRKNRKTRPAVKSRLLNRLKTSRRQRGVAAQVDLPGRGEPAKMVPVLLFYGKGGFGKIVLPCDIHHLLLWEPLVQNADGSRIPVEYPVRKSVYDILLHKNLLPFCFGLRKKCGFWSEPGFFAAAENGTLLYIPLSPNFPKSKWQNQRDL